MENHGARLTEYLNDVGDALKGMKTEPVEDAIAAIMKAYEDSRTIYIMGNGGSGSAASHATYDFNVAVTGTLEKKFRFVSLCDNITTLLALSNDYGFENVFYMQLLNVLKEGDLVICISGSGNSDNVIKAAEYARSMGNEVIAFTGFDGGKLKDLADYSIAIEIDDMQKAEDCHAILLHAIARSVSESLGQSMCRRIL